MGAGPEMVGCGLDGDWIVCWENGDSYQFTVQNDRFEVFGIEYTLEMHEGLPRFFWGNGTEQRTEHVNWADVREPGVEILWNTNSEAEDMRRIVWRRR